MAKQAEHNAVEDRPAACRNANTLQWLWTARWPKPADHEDEKKAKREGGGRRIEQEGGAGGGARGGDI